MKNKDYQFYRSGKMVEEILNIFYYTRSAKNKHNAITKKANTKINRATAKVAKAERKAIDAIWLADSEGITKILDDFAKA